MNNWKTVNDKILQRSPCRSYEENTYYNYPLFEKFCSTKDYKKVAIYGYYKSVYGWSDEEAETMYNRCPDGWTDGLGIYRLYDWGKGKNRIECGEDREWHEPQLDHIVPRSKGGSNLPDNLQVLPAILNRILTNLTDDQAPSLVPLILKQLGM